MIKHLSLEQCEALRDAGCPQAGSEFGWYKVTHYPRYTEERNGQNEIHSVLVAESWGRYQVLHRREPHESSFSTIKFVVACPTLEELITWKLTEDGQVTTEWLLDTWKTYNDDTLKS